MECNRGKCSEMNEGWRYQRLSSRESCRPCMIQAGKAVLKFRHRPKSSLGWRLVGTGAVEENRAQDCAAEILCMYV